jgi:uncharacterized protein YjbJ (UPF0337 family)
MNNAVNENLLKGKWTELKGEVQKLWGRLTDDELEQTKGEAKSLGGLVQQKYGIKEEEFREKVNGIINKFEPSKMNDNETKHS